MRRYRYRLRLVYCRTHQSEEYTHTNDKYSKYNDEWKITERCKILVHFEVAQKNIKAQE